MSEQQPKTLADGLFIKYAQNRMELKRIKHKLHLIFFDDGRHNEQLEISMKNHRKSFYEEYPGYWAGWVACMDHNDIIDGIEMEVSILWDKKRKLIQEAGKIKRAIYAEGARRIKEGRVTK